MEKIDESDKKILSMLQVDCKTSLAEMAKVLGTTQSTVKRRIDNLVEKGVIKRFTAVVNSARFAMESIAIARISADPPKKMDIASGLARLDEVTEVYTGTGEYNILAKIRCGSGAEIEEFLHKLLLSKDVSKVDVFVVLQKVKEEPGVKIVSGATITEEDIDGDELPELVLNNPYVRVVVDPADGGRIKEYILKETWSNNIASEGLLSDAFLEAWKVWEPGWDLTRVPFKYQIAKHSVDEASVRLWARMEKPRIPGLMLEKKIALSADSEALRVTYRLVNESKEEKTATLWIRNYMRIGEGVGPRHIFNAPLESGIYAEGFERSFSGKIFLQDGHDWTPLVKERWESEKTLQWPEEKISEGWGVYTDRDTDVSLGLIWNPREVKCVKRYFIYDSYSIELVFETVTLQPKASKEFSFTIVLHKEGWNKVRDQYMQAMEK